MSCLQLNRNEVLIENVIESVVAPISLRDDEELFCISEEYFTAAKNGTVIHVDMQRLQ